MSAQYDELNAWNEIKYILENDATLSVYVKEVFQGDREGIAMSKYPCIIMEDAGGREDTYTHTARKKGTFVISLILATHITDNDDQITGSGTPVGILKFTADVRNALDAYPKLDKRGMRRAIMFSFPSVEAGNIVETYPYRYRKIAMEVVLVSNEASR